MFLVKNGLIKLWNNVYFHQTLNARCKISENIIGAPKIQK
jgi:hypothetical protein